MSTLFQPSTQAEMLDLFLEVCHTATEIVMRELIRILYYIMKCAHSHTTHYNILNMFYVTVPATIYKLIDDARANHPGVPQNPRVLTKYGMEETSAGQAQIRDAWAL